MEERGVNVDHATLNRWVIRYSPTIAVKAISQKRKTNRSWRMDETGSVAILEINGKIMNMVKAVKKEPVKIVQAKSVTAIDSPKPFIKWVGGKRQILPELIKRMPEKVASYYEPFIGGGALLWSLHNKKVESIVISDYNHELSNLYQVVKSHPERLIESLKKHKNTEYYFYELRRIDREKSYQKISSIKKASRFIYINKTGFNGLYRVNMKGENNVPFGRYSNPKIVDEINLWRCSNFLQDVKVMNGDFECIKSFIDQDSFVYLDPPYIPLSSTSNFTSYTEQGFDIDMQFRLREFCDYIDSVGAKFMLSNSSSQLVYELYESYNVDIVMASRVVNCKGTGRGKIEELIIRNY
jgi:DNA adenine methylase